MLLDFGLWLATDWSVYSTHGAMGLPIVPPTSLPKNGPANEPSYTGRSSSADGIISIAETTSSLEPIHTTPQYCGLTVSVTAAECESGVPAPVVLAVTATL